jgi:hypothetical protein
MRVKLLKPKNMSSLPNISEMSLVEYVDFIELRAIHLGISAEELNMENCFEIGVISNEWYERAKAELIRRDIMFAHYGEY